MRYLPAILAATAAIAAVAAPASAAAPGWSVNYAGSRVTFGASMAGQPINGQFRRWNASIAFDPKALDQSRVVATIDMGSAVTGDATRDKSLPTPDWFNTAAFPRAQFVSSRFRDLGNGNYQAIGDLTIRGVRRPVVLPFRLRINGNVAQMQGSLVLNRTAFGVGQGQFRGVDTVAGNVRVDITINAVRRK